MKRAVTAAVAGTLVALVAAGCGNRDSTVATVNGVKIEKGEIESLIDLYRRRSEAEAEGEGKESVTHVQEVATLHVLIQREIVAQEAQRLGVHVPERLVEQHADALRGRGTESSSDESKESELEDQIRATARAQLLYDGVRRKVTRGVDIPAAAVTRYYRTHLALYSSNPAAAAKVPPANVRRAITRGLLATRRDQLMARWLTNAAKRYKSKITYEKGWAPTPGA